MPRAGNVRRTPSGAWRWELERGRGPDGRRMRWSGTAPTRADAEDALAAKLMELGESPVRSGSITLAEWWRYYRRTKGMKITRATMEGYASAMKLTWLPKLGACRLDAITPSAVQAVVRTAPSRTTAKAWRRALSAVLSQAVTDGALARNPLLGVRMEYPERPHEPVRADEDPFTAIEGRMDVWGVAEVLEAAERLRGCVLEELWLAMVGAGLRREEALALTWRDVRRVHIMGRPVVQLAVHAALTALDGRKETKTARSVRIVSVAEPFASRLWELRREPTEPVSRITVDNVNRAWRNLWEPRRDNKHVPRDRDRLLAGRMLEPWPLRYITLNRMRATHASMVQAAGVLDSVNAAVHGHSQKVAYEHYLRPDDAGVAWGVGELFVRGRAGTGEH